jgi:hypothetical protein
MRSRWSVLVAAGFLAVVPPAFARAVFSPDAVPDPGFTTKTVRLSVTPSTEAVAFEGMAPGDQTVGSATVLNDGATRLRYATRTSVAGSRALAEALVLTIKSGVEDCSREGFDAGGATRYQGPAAGGAFGGAVLEPGSAETLCFRVRLPLSVSNALQGSSASAAFTFTAEQAANG